MIALTKKELKQLADSQKTLSEMMEEVAEKLGSDLGVISFSKPQKNKWGCRVTDFKKIYVNYSKIGLGPTPEAALTAAMEEMIATT